MYSFGAWCVVRELKFNLVRIWQRLLLDNPDRHIAIVQPYSQAVPRTTHHERRTTNHASQITGMQAGILVASHWPIFSIVGPRTARSLGMGPCTSTNVPRHYFPNQLMRHHSRFCNLSPIERVAKLPWASGLKNLKLRSIFAETKHFAYSSANAFLLWCGMNCFPSNFNLHPI